jgi:hypothetical protein
MRLSLVGYSEIGDWGIGLVSRYPRGYKLFHLRTNSLCDFPLLVAIVV